MSVKVYNKELRLAISDDLYFPSEDSIDSLSVTPDPLALEEYQTYYVKFYGEAVQPFFESVPFKSPIPGLKSIFEINFHNVTGLTRIGPITIRVQSRKISEKQYEVMLDYITDKLANLIFSFAGAVGQCFRKGEPGQDIPYIEYLFLKKFLLGQSPQSPGITAIANLITADPHRKIFRDFRYNTIDMISHIEPSIVSEIFSTPEKLAILPPDHLLLSSSLGRIFLEKTRKPLYPTEILEEFKYQSVDTNENRFIKFFLDAIQKKVTQLHDTFEGQQGSYFNPDIDIDLARMKREIKAFQSANFWIEVGDMQYIPTNSQVLQRRDGYKQLFHLYSLLQLVTRCDFNSSDFKNIVATKDTPTLFEYWCFFLVKGILDQSGKILLGDIFVAPNISERERLLEQGIKIDYDNGITLWFNKTFSIGESYSHDMRPDIVITKGAYKLIFDAKFKGQRVGFYGESEGGYIDSCKPEDIDKMHTYREAISNVSGAFILYPGNEQSVFSHPKGENSYQGVGALPLKPDEENRTPNKTHLDNVRKIIDHFIASH